MKKYSIYIVIFTVGIFISIYGKKITGNDNYILLFPIILFMVPFLKFLFPQLKELEIGTSNFFLNLLKKIKGSF